MHYDQENKKLLDTFVKDMKGSLHSKAEIIQEWLPRTGKVIEVGTGVGLLANYLADTNPNLDVVGIDASQEMIRRANKEGQQATFQQGNALEPLPSADFLIYSSIMHEIFSYNGKEFAPIEKSLEQAYAALPKGGKILVTDFVAPTNGDQTIYVEHNINDVKDGHTLNGFANDFAERHGLRYANPRIWGYLSDKSSTKARYHTNVRTAYEYMFRKDFNGRWNYEMDEVYTFWTGREARQLLENAGFNVFHYREFNNGWIENNRLKKKLTLLDLDLNPIKYPRYKMVMVGEK